MIRSTQRNENSLNFETFPSIPTNQSMSTTETSGSDPILSWGSSVNVCEDLRRQIRSEIERIDVDVAMLKKNLKAEDSCSRQLGKDLSYARSEMINLVQGSAEQLENAVVNEQIRLKMGDSLKTELATKVVTPPISPDTIPQFAGRYEQDINDSNGDFQNKNRELESYDSSLLKMNAEKTTLENTIRKDLDEFRETKSKIQKISQEYAGIMKKIESKELSRERHNIALEVETREKQIEKKNQQLRALKDGIQITRKRCGDFAQQIVDQSKILSSEKSKNSTYEEQIASNIAILKQETDHLNSNELHTLKKEMESITSEITDLNGKLDQVEAIRKKRAIVKKELETLKSDVTLLQEDKKIATAKEMESSEKVRSTEAKLKEAHDMEMSLNVLKLENDENERNKMGSLLMKQNEFARKREELVEHIARLHNELSSEEEIHRGEVTKKKKDIDEMKAKIKDITLKIERNAEEFNKIELSIEKDSQNTRKDLEAYESFKVQMEDAIKAEEKRKEEMLLERKLKKEKKLADALKESAIEQQSLEYTIQLYKKAVEMKENTDQLVQQLELAPISKFDIENVGEFHETIASKTNIMNPGNVMISNRNDCHLDRLQPSDHSCSTQQTDNTNGKSRQQHSIVD